MTSVNTVAGDAQLALACLDFTRLNEQDDEQAIISFLDQLRVNKPLPAAICVYPQWLKLVCDYMNAHLSAPISLATVTNFPSGEQPLHEVLEQTQRALELGANEIDLVLPYKAMLASDEPLALKYVRNSKEVCQGRAKLKVIIESGELPIQRVALATRIAIEGGADFVKTSTGKVPVNATLEAVEVMLEEIKRSDETVGLKVSGGVKTLQQAQEYMQLVASMMGKEWITPNHFRFGASSLLEELYAVL
ncbi:deoxyribose-phosphate aldolase [Pseudoalteromonas sp. SSDWG2]|uniref:deoxyribose-phosphate aldolase n=1 Tax=Pseudoalteromonas sp. SSDWG2 TaxID=3139391 RepID=UPI003BAD9976